MMENGLIFIDFWENSYFRGVKIEKFPKCERKVKTWKKDNENIHPTNVCPPELEFYFEKRIDKNRT